MIFKECSTLVSLLSFLFPLILLSILLNANFFAPLAQFRSCPSNSNFTAGSLEQILLHFYVEECAVDLFLLCHTVDVKVV